MSCLFCRIIKKDIPSKIIYENDDVICFEDIHPAAPVHVLIVPKKHFDDILDMAATDDGKQAMQAVLEAVSIVSQKTGTQDGFRLINNCKEDGGQTIMHAHFHLLGGKKLHERLL